MGTPKDRSRWDWRARLTPEEREKVALYESARADSASALAAIRNRAIQRCRYDAKRRPQHQD